MLTDIVAADDEKENILLQYIFRILLYEMMILQEGDKSELCVM